MQSSIRALSRTLRDTTRPVDSPPHPSPASGANETRPRDGLRPNSPHWAAGIRMEPPPSVACATGKMPAATAAAAPPDEPPAECARFHGLRHEPNRRGSVFGLMPNSGVELRPMMTSPAFLHRVT